MDLTARASHPLADMHQQLHKARGRLRSCRLVSNRKCVAGHQPVCRLADCAQRYWGRADNCSAHLTREKVLKAERLLEAALQRHTGARRRRIHLREEFAQGLGLSRLRRPVVASSRCDGAS